MATIAPTPKPAISDPIAVCMVLGIDPLKVQADSLTLEPWGNGHWLVQWRGGAVLDSEAAALLFANDHA